MDFRFTEEEENFRKEVREFMERELPNGYVGEGLPGADAVSSDEDWAFAQQMTRKLVAKGWLVMGWPKEYGGQGTSIWKDLIFNEERMYHRCPGFRYGGVGMIGPALMVHGTEEQKKRHLPAIARGEVDWCEGYSEPNAGSDLASIQTRAVEEGDHYIINGQKIWTTGAHRADWCFFLARTDPEATPKHRGISFFLVDLKTPGITIRPIIDMAGEHHWNEVFFDNVRVPKENLVGEKNRGFYVAMTLLDFERTAMVRSAFAQRIIKDLVQYAKEKQIDNQPLAKNPIVRQKLAEMWVECEVNRLISYHIAWTQSKGLVSSYEASMARAFGNELIIKLAKVAMQIVGPYEQLKPGSKWETLLRRIQLCYTMSKGEAFGGGSTLIQKNVIGSRGLGLPKSY